MAVRFEAIDLAAAHYQVVEKHDVHQPQPCGQLLGHLYIFAGRFHIARGVIVRDYHTYRSEL